MSPNEIKRFLAQALDVAGINSLGFFLQCRLLGPFLRVINYHDIKQTDIDNFRRQLGYYAEHFENVTPDLLEQFLHNGRWPHQKPGLIISFDDGLRSHFTNAAPLLEEFGFTGWFFVPSGWVVETDGSDGPGENLTLDQLRYLSEHHVVGSHTITHCRLSSELDRDVLEREIGNSKKELEAMTGKVIATFCWVGGEESSYSRGAAEIIKREYRFSFMTNNAVVRPSTNPLQIQRTNIESENPISLIRFQLSGLMDLFYYPKRRRVNRLTT